MLPQLQAIAYKRAAQAELPEYLVRLISLSRLNNLEA
jgi:hypothetical protein